MKHRVVWCSRGWQPICFGFCPSEKAWAREMRRLGIKGEPFPTSDGRCTTFVSKGKTCAIVTVRERKDTNELLGLLAHEATHVWQEVRRAMGEQNPSPEFEAYSLQAIVQELHLAYTASRKRK